MSKADWVEDINFVLSECARIQHELQTDAKGWIKSASLADTFARLPAVKGTEPIQCGAAARLRLRALSDLALRHSDARNTTTSQEVLGALSIIVVERFIFEKRPVDEQQVERALSAAVKRAKSKRYDAIHFIPCRLMTAVGPGEFTVGPVVFRSRASFFERLQPHVDAAWEDSARKGDAGNIIWKRTKEYYDAFTWVAEVKILNCDPAISEERAQLAVTAALDTLHVVFSESHTHRMAVGGPTMAADRRAHIHLNANDRLCSSASSAATSAVGFPEDWGKFLKDDTIIHMFRGAGKAIEPIVNPSAQSPLGLRFVDAASWYGQAVREAPAASRVIKAMTALERLVVTREENIAATLSARGAALAFDPEKDKSLADLKAQLSKCYDLRSRLVHGSLSPFDPEVRSQSALCLHLCGRILAEALFRLQASRAFEVTAMTDAKLKDGLEIWFAGIVKDAEAQDATLCR